MLDTRCTRHRLMLRLHSGLAVGLMLMVAARAPADPLGAPPPHPVLSLPECIHIALDKQPSVAAARASLAGAVASQQYISSVRIPTFLRPDLPVRRCQAALGVEIAQAGLRQVESDTIYAVTRTYLTVVYAQQQWAAVERALASLRARRQEVTKWIDEGTRKDVTSRTMLSIDLSITVLRARLDETIEGAERGKAALREAMGVGPDFCLEIACNQLPEPETAACREQIVELALSRRGEVVMAEKGAETVALEVNAQAKARGFQVSTFAAGTDLHANPLPQVSSDDYRPSPLGLEMPATLSGSRCFRVERAQLYSVRTDAVVAKTRNLVALDAEDAYLRWTEAKGKLASLTRAADLAEELAASFMKEYRDKPAGTVKYEEGLTAEVLAMSLRGQAIEGLYRYNLAVAGLARVTAGGYCAAGTR